MHTSIARMLYGRESPVPQTRDLPAPRTILAGRILLGLIFLLSGIGKVANFSATAQALQAQGLAGAWVLLGIAAAIELLGGLAIITGTFARLGALVLFLYLIPITVLFHAFWGVEGIERQIQMANFFKNLAIMGGLLLLVGFGAGRVSVDQRIKPRGSIPADNGSRAPDHPPAS